MIRIFIFFALSMIIAPGEQAVPERGSDRPLNQSPMVSFGLITDVQYCNCDPEGTRFYNRSLGKLRNAISDLDDSGVAFTINLGDLIDRNWSSYDSVMPILNESKSRVYSIAGNHDFSIEERRRKNVNSLLGLDEKGYYSFNAEGFRFIVLNTTEISEYSPVRQNRKEASRMIEELLTRDAPNAFNWNGGVSGSQLAWFREELDRSAGEGQKVIILSHHPAYPASEFNIFNSGELLEAIAGRPNVIAWFSGHDHQGSYDNLNMVHFVGFRGMVETDNTNSYSVIELYHNKIWIKGRGREKKMILAY